MRLIVIGLAVSFMALTFATTSTRVDNVSGTVTQVGTSCFDYNLTVDNDRGGPNITGVLVFATYPPGSVIPTSACITGEPLPPEAPAGWSRQFLEEGPSYILAEYEADRGKAAIRKGQSLSGFIVRVGACPLSVELWTTFKKNGVQTAAGSFVIPCP